MLKKFAHYIAHEIASQSDNQAAAISGMITCNFYGLFLFSNLFSHGVCIQLEGLVFKVVGAVLCSGVGAFTGLIVKHLFDKKFKKEQ